MIFGEKVFRALGELRAAEVDDETDISHHGIKGMHWGVRRYQNPDGSYTDSGKIRRQMSTESKAVLKNATTTPQPFKKQPIDRDTVKARGSLTDSEADKCIFLADELFTKASRIEPQITTDILDVVKSNGATMYGLNHRLKQPTSLAAKIGSDSKKDNTSFEKSASNINDSIRYTVLSNNNNFTDIYNSFQKSMTDKGYTEVKCKNYFQDYRDGKVSHKAVQSSYLSPSGMIFEVQFQTPLSQAAKELKIPLYEEVRQSNTTPKRRQELVSHMRELADNVSDPPGVFDISSFKKESIKHSSVFGERVIPTDILMHHGIKGQHWGIKNGPPYPLNSHQGISKESYQKLNDIYKSMSSADRRMIDPDSNDGDGYFPDYRTYKSQTAYNGIADDGFIVAEKIPRNKNVNDTRGVEIGIGVISKGRGTGTRLVEDMKDWFDSQDEFDTMWWPVDKNNAASIALAKKCGFVKDPYGDNYIYANGEAYRKLGIYDKHPDDIYSKLNTFDYGCIIDGKRYNETNLDEVDWSKYKTTPIKDFEKTKIGTCWDYTNYQHAELSKAGIKHDTHMLVMDTDDGPVTHTFTTFEDPINHRQYWLEQALYSERGIHPIGSYKDAVSIISKKYDASGKRDFDVYRFNPDGMDSGLTDQEFFNKATAGDPIMQNKLSHSSLFGERIVR